VKVAALEAGGSGGAAGGGDAGASSVTISVEELKTVLPTLLLDWA
jgi:hypothetical protein